MSLPRARLLVLLAATLWSSSGLFAKAPLFDAWPSESRGILLAFWRALFAGFVLLPAVRRPRFRPALIPMVGAFTAMSVTYLSAMTLTTAANAIWLQSTAPFWVLLIGLALGSERPARAELVPLVFGGVGVALILFHEARGQAGVGIFCGLAAGVAYAAIVIALRALRDEDPVWLVALNHLAAAAFLLPIVVAVGHWPTLTQLGVLAAFGTVQMAIPYLLLTRALATVTSQEAIGIGLIEPVLLPLWVYLAWREVPSAWTLAGGAIILVGLALRYAWPLLMRPRPQATWAEQPLETELPR